MTSILLSVRPEWLAKILNGEKTVEIRKNVPKLPCEVFLYCTKAYQSVFFGVEEQKIIFTTKHCLFAPLSRYKKLNGLVVAKFTLKEAKVTGFVDLGIPFYLKTGYAWHITGLVIFEKPMKLGEFYTKKCKHFKADYKPEDNINEKLKHCNRYVYSRIELARAPSGWQYVEVLK